MNLLLASSSKYRRELLERLRIPFHWESPAIDETTQSNERPENYVERLAIQKALALKDKYPQHWIIGSDQACVINNTIMGKPHTRENAIKQLLECSDTRVTFYTGLCLLSPDNTYQSTVEPFHVHFRELTQDEIERYIDLEMPLDCAGSFKMEGLGINLFKRLEGRDSTTLIGLPLIALLEMLRLAGINPLAEAH